MNKQHMSANSAKKPISLSTSKELVIAAMLGLLTFIGTYISIPMYPVPITMQTLFVLLSGFYLSPYFAALSMLVCLLLRLVTSGISLFVAPSFGFLIAFIVAAYLISYCRKKFTLRFKGVFIVLALAEIVIYLIGLPYMAYILNVYLGKGLSFYTLMKVGMLLFIPGDIVKLLLAAYIYRFLPTLNKLR